MDDERDKIVEQAASDMLLGCFDWHAHQTNQRHPSHFLNREKVEKTISRAVEDATYELRRELATVRHYMNKDNEAMVDEAIERGEFIEPMQLRECEHEWVDATNEVIESGEVCVKCFAVRPTQLRNRTLRPDAGESLELKPSRNDVPRLVAEIRNAQEHLKEAMKRYA